MIKLPDVCRICNLIYESKNEFNYHYFNCIVPDILKNRKKIK